MGIQGLRDTGNFVADQRPKNWREGTLLLFPNGKAPLYGLTSTMKKRSVDDPEFNWWEKEFANQRVALAANLTAPAAGTIQTITLTEGASQLKDGHILWVEEGGDAGELLLVNGDPASDTAVTVIRGYAGSTVAAVTFNGAGVNPHLTVVGNAYEEASEAPTGINYDPIKNFNFTQIFRNTLEMSRTATKTRLRTGDQVREAKRECLQYHSVEIERALWFGRRFEGVRNGKPIRTMNGVLRQIPAANVKSAPSGEVSMEWLEERLYEMFLFGSTEKMVWCGNRALLAIQQAVRRNSHVNIQSGIKEFGMNVTRLTSPFGELVFKTHPLFNILRSGATGGTDYHGVESWAVVLDMENIQYVYLRDSDTKYEQKLQDNGLDGMKSGYLTECSMELHHAKTHHLLKNLVTGIEDPSE